MHELFQLNRGILILVSRSLIFLICSDLFIYFFHSGFEQMKTADYLNTIATLRAARTESFISVSRPRLDLTGAKQNERSKDTGQRITRSGLSVLRKVQNVIFTT